MTGRQLGRWRPRRQEPARQGITARQGRFKDWQPLHPKTSPLPSCPEHGGSQWGQRSELRVAGRDGSEDGSEDAAHPRAPGLGRACPLTALSPVSPRTGTRLSGAQQEPSEGRGHRRSQVLPLMPPTPPTGVTEQAGGEEVAPRPGRGPSQWPLHQPSAKVGQRDESPTSRQQSVC